MRNCQIQRRVFAVVGYINPIGELVVDEEKSEHVVRACGEPLNAGEEYCINCRRGEEVPDNRFASMEEKSRAMGGVLTN